MNRWSSVVSVATTLALAACASSSPRAVMPAAQQPTAAVAADSGYRFSADQAQMWKGGDQLLTGHVTMQFPTTGTQLQIKADTSASHEDGSTELGGNVTIRFGDLQVTSAKALVTTSAGVTSISMEQARVTKVTSAPSG
jgi:hypothetical protein